MTKRSKKYIQTIGIWLLVYLSIFFPILRYSSWMDALTFSVVFVTPMIPITYLHFKIFETYYLEQRKKQYAFITLLVLIIGGYSGEYLIDHFLKVESDYFIFLIIFCLASTGFKYFTIQTKHELALKEEEAKRIKSEMDLLKLEINPHFLFNSLNSIYSLSLESNQNVSKSILLLSNLMRYLLYSSKSSKVTIQQECEFIENYIFLEKLRLDKRCRICFSISGEFLGKSIPPMLFLPFIENAFKHGISNTAKNNYVNIDLELLKDSLVFKVENNIAPKKKDDLAKRPKVGIDNVRKRLSLLYSNNYDLKIDSDNNDYKVRLELKL